MNYSGLKTLFQKSKDGVDSNLLILLHGLGDRASNFIQFGSKMELPQTALLAIEGPCAIPWYEDGTAWFPKFDDEACELSAADPKVKKGIKKTRELLLGFLQDRVFVSEQNPTGWKPDRVFIFGFSQGGIMALDILLFGNLEIGGVVSVSGWLEKDAYDEIGSSNSPILITQGTSDQFINMQGVQQKLGYLKSISKHVNYIPVPGKGHGLPRDKLEMKEIMTFFSKHLWLRNLALEGMADVHEISR